MKYKHTQKKLTPIQLKLEGTRLAFPKKDNDLIYFLYLMLEKYKAASYSRELSNKAKKVWKKNC